MNGATEATLMELLAVARLMNTNLENLVKKMGGTIAAGGSGATSSVGSAAQTASTSLAGLSSNAEKVGKAFNSLGYLVGSLASGAFSLLSSAISSVVSGLVQTAGALAHFVKETMDGTAKLSGLYAAFENIPIIGKVFSLFSFLVKQLEELLDTYRTLTKVGADFGGNLYHMRNQAGEAGMTLEQFAGFVRSNSELLANMGTSVQSGIDKFVEINGLLTRGKFSRDLQGLGFTAAETAQYLTTVAQSQGMLARQGSASSDELAEKTRRYMIGLDQLTKITGMRTEQIDAEVKKAQQDQAWQIYLNSLSNDQKEFAETMIATVAPFGPAIVQQVKNSLRGMDAPIDDLTTGLGVISKGASITGGAQLRYAMATAKNTEDITKAGLLYAYNLGTVSTDTAVSLGNVGLAANENLLTTANGVIEFARRVDAGGKGVMGTFDAIKKRQEVQAKGNAGVIGTAEQNLMNFGNALRAIFYEIVGPITDTLVNIGFELTDIFFDGGKLKSNFQGLIKWAQEIADWLNGWLKKLVSDLSDPKKDVWDVLMDSLKDLFTGVMEKIVVPVLRTLWNDVLKPFLMTLYGDIYDAMPWLGKKFMPDPYKVSADSKEIAQAKAELKKKKGIDIDKDTLDDDSLLKYWDEIETRAEEIRRQNIKNPEWNKKDKDKKTTETTEAVAPTAKAVGGSFNPGVLLVGEKGPELVATGSSGNVITNENFTTLMNNIASSGQVNSTLASSLNTLNNQTARLISTMEAVADYTRRNNTALKNLSRDAFV